MSYLYRKKKKGGGIQTQADSLQDNTCIGKRMGSSGNRKGSDTPVRGWTITLPNPYFYFVFWFLITPKHTHTLWYPKRGARSRPVSFPSHKHTHILYQCSPCPLVTLRGVAGVCLSWCSLPCSLVNNPRGRLVCP